MRLIDATHMEVVSVGLGWRHAVSPCSKQAIHLLERNTKVVTWLMPTGGKATEQIPCILYKGKYCSLSLRMQKAVYRHIRLKKGFTNEETVNGMQKLRIPDLLLKEKIRTQSRFDVSLRLASFRGARSKCGEQPPARCARPSIAHARYNKHTVPLPWAWQAMRHNHKGGGAGGAAGERRERAKSVNTVAVRMKQVVVCMRAIPPFFLVVSSLSSSCGRHAYVVVVVWWWALRRRS
jgi:hypothetical protein